MPHTALLHKAKATHSSGRFSHPNEKDYVCSPCRAGRKWTGRGWIGSDGGRVGSGGEGELGGGEGRGRAGGESGVREGGGRGEGEMGVREGSERWE